MSSNKKSKLGVTYTAISIPDKLKEEIKEYIIKSGRYVSVGDFVRDAIRERFEKIDNLSKK